MKNVLFSVFILLLFAAESSAQWWWGDNYPPYDSSVELTETNLPIVFIDVDGETISRYERITARMKIIHNGDGETNYADTLAHKGQLVDYEGYVALRYRGNSSYNSSDKKPYSFRTLDNSLEKDGQKKKVEILGMGKDNNWALLAPFSDKSMIRDMLAFELSRQWMEFVPQGRFCEVVLDGTYYGVYVLCEVVSKGKHRLNLPDPGNEGDALTGGYMVEVDRSEDYAFFSNYHPVDRRGNEYEGNSICFQYKFPDYEDMTDEQDNYIRTAVDRMEQSLASADYRNPETGYARYIDVMSFADYQLAKEFGHDVDGYRLSGKMYKRRDSEDSRFKMALWDMNLAYGNSDYYDGWRTDTWVYENNEMLYDYNDPQLVPFWWHKLNTDANYRNILKERWAEYRHANFSDESIVALVDSMVSLLNSHGAQQRNTQAWDNWGVYVWPNYYVALDYDDEIDYLKQWLADRIAWMDEKLEYDPNKPLNVRTAADTHRIVAYYTPDGKKISMPAHGFYIVKYDDGTTRKIAL